MRTHPQNKQQFNLQFGVVFTRLEIDRAVAEINVKEISISSVGYDDIYVGFTQNRVGNRYVSAYMAGYWLGCLKGGATVERSTSSILRCRCPLGCSSRSAPDLRTKAGG